MTDKNTDNNIDWGDDDTPSPPMMAAGSNDSIDREVFKSALEVDTAMSTDTLDVGPSVATTDRQLTDAHDSENESYKPPPSYAPSSPIKHYHQKQLDKLSRHIPPSLDLHYITPQLVGMAPPRSKYPLNDETSQQQPSSTDPTTSTTTNTIRKPNNKRSHENDPAELSSFLESRHPKRYLLFNVSDEDVDDRSLLLLGRQVVHLPWGSPRIIVNHANNSNKQNNSNSASSSLQLTSSQSFERSNSLECPVSPTPSQNSLKGVGSNESTSYNHNSNSSNNNKSSQTPSVSRVMEICYALHAYLTTSTVKGKRSTIACVYCSNGKTRTGVVAACYLRYADKVPDSFTGFELFCERRGIRPGASSSSDGNKDMAGHIPPSLRQFFKNFDEVVRSKRYPHPEPLLLKRVLLQGVPVDDMPCIDIWEHGDVARHQVYSSHDDITLNEWDDDEGCYNIGQILNRDFSLVCRFGGMFAQDADDPTKVLFRYVNSTKFLKEGGFELVMTNVDMMRRYADSFDEEDFLLTLEFENIDDQDDEDAERRRMSIAPGLRLDALQIGDRVLEGMDSILHGWRVISESHFSHLSFLEEDELEMDSPSYYSVDCLGSNIDFRRIALQLANGDAKLAKHELSQGLFGRLLTLSGKEANEYESNIVDATIKTVSLDDSFEVPEQKKSLDDDSYFTANDDEIEEQSNDDESLDPSMREESRQPPQSRNENSFSGPELIVIEEDNVEEEKITDELIMMSGESSHDYPQRNCMSPETHGVYDNISEPNTPFADRSRSSFLDALKLREIGKSLSSVRIDERRASLLKEITESAQKRNRSIEGYEEYTEKLTISEPNPNALPNVEKYSTPRSDVDSSILSASSKSLLEESESRSVASDEAVLSPVMKYDEPDAPLSGKSPIHIQQPILDEDDAYEEEITASINPAVATMKLEEDENECNQLFPLCITETPSSGEIIDEALHDANENTTNDISKQSLGTTLNDANVDDANDDAVKSIKTEGASDEGSTSGGNEVLEEIDTGQLPRNEDSTLISTMFTEPTQPSANAEVWIGNNECAHMNDGDIYAPPVTCASHSSSPSVSPRISPMKSPAKSLSLSCLDELEENSLHDDKFKDLQPFTIPSIILATYVKTTPDQKVGLALTKSKGIVVIDKIKPGSAFDGSELRAGQELLCINHHRVRSAKRAAEIVR
eukprot:scaffold9485_cov69-Cyclotella_meneghiniana.AAC.5